MRTGVASTGTPTGHAPTELKDVPTLLVNAEKGFGNASRAEKEE